MPQVEEQKVYIKSDGTPVLGGFNVMEGQMTKRSNNSKKGRLSGKTWVKYPTTHVTTHGTPVWGGFRYEKSQPKTTTNTTGTYVIPDYNQTYTNWMISKLPTSNPNNYTRNTKTNRNITFNLPTNNDGITLQEASIDNSPVSVIPSINIPETIEVPQVNTPGNFSRRDIRNLLRSKGIDPYYEIGGLQRRALRRYLNGEPVSGEYQDFINKIMQ